MVSVSVPSTHSVQTGSQIDYMYYKVEVRASLRSFFSNYKVESRVIRKTLKGNMMRPTLAKFKKFGRKIQNAAQIRVHT